MSPLTLGGAALAVAIAASTIGHAEPAAPAQGGGAGAGRGGVRAPADASPLRTLKVQGSVHVILDAGANIVVQLGDQGVVMVDTGTAEHADRVLATLRTVTPRPVRNIVNTHAHADHVGGNERIGASGQPISGRGVAQVGAGLGARAEIIAHEETLNRMSAPAGTVAPTPVAAWPTSTFSSDYKDFFYNNDGIHIRHIANAHTDGDTIVFFRRSDVIATGDIYSTVDYPRIDLERGGSITGVLAGLNKLLEMAIAGEKTEGGTLLVPGHGRISDEADLVEYRDMTTIIRDRIQDMVNRGMTVQQVQAARPTMEYDGLYGNAPGWSAAQFVEAVYKGLKPQPASRSSR
jgi:glyoxylase-like metal-dependent hydrolase (beta-lactamase superfamily II)